MSAIELVRARPPAASGEERAVAKRDERDERRAFVEREHERTDMVRLGRGMEPLYVDEGDCSPWAPGGATAAGEDGA